MKKVASLLLIIITLASCTQDISKNNPAMQGWKDDVLWRARDRFAELSENGSISIMGLTRYETLIIKLPSTAATTHVLGTSETRKATYIHSRDNVETVFTTGTGIGDGEVVIEEYDTENQTITGRFRFNLVNVENDSVVNFQHGVFYRVPVVPAL